MYFIEDLEMSMNFSRALEKAKLEKKIWREGWNGSDMWVVLMPELTLPPRNSVEDGPKVNYRTARYIGDDKTLNCQPYFALWTALGAWQPGWLPSQADLLAEDWRYLA